MRQKRRTFTKELKEEAVRLVVSGQRTASEVAKSLKVQQAVRTIGTFAYHFRMSSMKPLKRKNGNQHLHRETEKYRAYVLRKIDAYHRFVQAGIIAHGLLQYLFAAHPALVWNSFASWIRTIRPGVPPSEMVTQTALRNTLNRFLLDWPKPPILAKFIRERTDANNVSQIRLAA